MSRILTALILGLSIVASLSPTTQDNENIIQKESLDGIYSAPFHITQILIDGDREVPGYSFRASEGWLYRMKIGVKNHSDRTLRHVGISVRFLPNTIAEQRVWKGRTYQYSPTASDGEDLVLEPGKETFISWRPKHVEWLKKEAAEYGAYMIKNVTLHEYRAIYDDLNTQWLEGGELTRNPIKPTEWSAKEQIGSLPTFRHEGGVPSWKNGFFKLVNGKFNLEKDGVFKLLNASLNLEEASCTNCYRASGEQNGLLCCVDPPPAACNNYCVADGQQCYYDNLL